MPNGRQTLAQTMDSSSLLVAQRRQIVTTHNGILLLQLLQRLQRVIPSLLQFTRYKSVLRLGNVVLSPSAINLIASAFQPQLPVAIQCLSLFLHRFHRLKNALQPGWFDCLKEDLTNRLVQMPNRKPLALRSRIIELRLATLIAVVAATVTNCHAPSASPANDDPLQ